MNVPIFIVSHLKDLRWLEYNLRSIKKFASGFSEVLVVVPLQELGHFLYLEEKYSRPDQKVWIKNFFQFPEKGMVHHEAIKCCADIYCPSATHILHTDSDCIFTEPVTPRRLHPEKTDAQTSFTALTKR